MPPLRVTIRFLLVFVLIYGALIVPWPGLRRAGTFGVVAAGRLVFAYPPFPGSVEIETL